MNFKISREDAAIIARIVDRAEGVAKSLGVSFDRLSTTMDLTAAHAARPMRLQDLLNADAFNFNHDVFGIVRHIDRTTGTLSDCFLPRSTVPEAAQ